MFYLRMITAARSPGLLHCLRLQQQCPPPVRRAASSTVMAPTAPSQPLEGPADVTAFINQINSAYLGVHVKYEENFWATKMGLAGASTAALAASKTAYDEFLADPANLSAVQERLKQVSV